MERSKCYICENSDCMKLKLSAVFLFLILFSVKLDAQVSPPGCYSMEVLDPDNDGYTSFDLDISKQLIIGWATDSGLDLSGYTMSFYDWDGVGGVLITERFYTNTVIYKQFCRVAFVHNSGPVYTHLQLSSLTCHALEAIPANGDADGDGILNSEEDSNHDGVLSDDDSDQDGLPDFRDPDFILATVSNSLEKFGISPNPASNLIQISGFQKGQYADIQIFDANGKQVMKIENPAEQIDISNFKPGFYLIKYKTSENVAVKKLVKL